MIGLEITLTADIVKAASSIKGIYRLEKLGDEEPGENYREDSSPSARMPDLPSVAIVRSNVRGHRADEMKHATRALLQRLRVGRAVRR